MSWKDWIFEEDPNAASHAKPTAPSGAATTSTQAPMNAPYDSQSYSRPTPAAAMNDQAYVRLADKTSFENTFAYKQLESFLEPLMGIIADPNLRFKAAFAQAKNGGLSEQKFLAAFDDMSNSLDSEQSAFNQMVEAKTQSEINAREAQVSKIETDMRALQQKIADLTAQTAQLQSDIASARGKIETAKVQFASAYARRKTEIAQQQKQYSAMLK